MSLKRKSSYEGYIYLDWKILFLRRKMLPSIQNLLDFSTSVSELVASQAGDVWPACRQSAALKVSTLPTQKMRTGLLFLFSKIITEHNSVVTYRTMEGRSPFIPLSWGRTDPFSDWKMAQPALLPCEHCSEFFIQIPVCCVHLSKSGFDRQTSWRQVQSKGQAKFFLFCVFDRATHGLWES